MERVAESDSRYGEASVLINSFKKFNYNGMKIDRMIETDRK